MNEWIELVYVAVTSVTLGVLEFWRAARTWPLHLVFLLPAGTEEDSPRVLIVDDLLVNQLVAKRMLERLGYSVETVDNGTDALRRLEETPFDLVLLDCQMPSMDGFEVSRAIRSSKMVLWSRVPIVAFTANGTRDGRERCLEAGMNDFLNKPVELQEMAQVLSHWIEVGIREKSSPTFSKWGRLKERNKYALGKHR